MVIKYNAEYNCLYCKNEFTKIVGRSETNSIVSSQVKCPKCSNFLKTFDDAIKITELREKGFKI